MYKESNTCRGFVFLLLAVYSLLQSSAVSAEEDNFMMLSAYNLAPYNNGYLESALPMLAEHDVAGIVYATLGHEERRYRETSGAWGLENENDYNKGIYTLAAQHRARIWLQLRVYDNTDGLYAKDADSFNIDSVIKNYVLNVGECRIILFEEASIYHRPGGGGSFWAGADLAATPAQNILNDQLFADNLASLFSSLKRRILAIDPTCAVGIHIGHAPVYRTIGDQSLLANAVSQMALAERPDFILYDLYSQVVGNQQVFEDRLRSRLVSIDRELRVPVYFMGQLHTTNYFQFGGAKSPTVEGLQAGIRVARESSVSGVGFYTKNTHSTSNSVLFENTNTNEKVEPGLHEPQKTVFESSKDRFDYGLQLIGKQQLRFDLVFTGNGLSRGGYRYRGYHGVPVAAGRGKLIVSIQHKSGRWDRFGVIDPTLRGLRYDYATNKQTYVIRGLRTSEYSSNDRVTVTLQANGDEQTVLDSILVVSSGDSSQFLSAEDISTNLPDSRLLGSRQSVTVSAAFPATISIQMNTSQGENPVTEQCVDSDGDGWGWNGRTSCRIENLNPTQRSEINCVDDDGDGWGWDGVKSCVIAVAPDGS